jgi:hypothetical protein
VTLWLVLCAMVVFALGGLGLDLWRVLDARRELVALADSAATAAASAVDADAAHRGELVLDVPRARQQAGAILRAHPRGFGIDAIAVDVDGASVTVSLAEEVDFALLDLLAGPGVTVRAEARAEPRRGS